MNRKQVLFNSTALILSAMLIAGCGNSAPASTATPKIAVVSSPPASISQTNTPIPPPITGSPTALAYLPTMLITSTLLPGSGATPLPSEQPLAPEQNPVGDIPDTQAFVSYTSAAGGYTLDTPEGWARTESGTNVSYVDKFDGVTVSITAGSSAPTAANSAALLAALTQSGRAMQVSKVTDVTLPSGAVLKVEYTANSDPNPVTGKQVRLELNTYYYFNAGKLATLTLYAPLGADNVDQWSRIAQSFKWVK